MRRQLSKPRPPTGPYLIGRPHRRERSPKLRVGEMVREIEEEVDDSTKAEAMLYARCCAAFEHAYNETDLPSENALGVMTAALFEATDRSGYDRVDVIESAREFVDDDTGWEYLTFHDLRRTWATALASADVDPLLVCDWGGWNDLETVLDHSRGTFSRSTEAGARRRRVALSGQMLRYYGA